MNTQATTLCHTSLSRAEMITHLIKLDLLSLQNKCVDDLSPSEIKLIWNLFIRHTYDEEVWIFTPQEIKHYLELDTFRGFPVPRFIVVIAELRSEMFFDQAHYAGRFSETSFENFLIDYIWFVKLTLFSHGTLPKKTFDWMFSRIDTGPTPLPKLAFAMYEGNRELKIKYNLSCPRQKFAYFIHFCRYQIGFAGYDFSNWLLAEINLPTMSADMKLIWNLIIRHQFQREEFLIFTSEEAQSYLETDHYRNFPVPHFINVIAELCEDYFFDSAHYYGEFANNKFEYYLIDYIWFIKRTLFFSYSFSKETTEWLMAPTEKDNTYDIQLPKLAWSIYLGSKKLREEYNLSDSQQKMAYLVYFCKDHFARLDCEYPVWLFDQFKLIENNCIKLTDISYTSSTYSRGGVNLVGWPRTAVGIGEDVRVAAHALLLANVPFSIQDAALRMPPRPKQEDLGVERYITQAPHYHTDITFLDAATQYRYYCYDLLKKSHLDRNIIGVCPWELPKWPRELAFALKHLTAFWAATRYIYNAFLPYFKEEQIHLVPPAVVLPEEELDDFEITTIDGPLTFLTTFDGLSSIHRKNPFAVIKAFKAAFPATYNDVRLIVKTMNFSPSHPDLHELAKMLSEDSRIEFINETLSREHLSALVRRSHCFVSLHRSEGFGRNIAEAMLFNRPVICSAYSGNLDFCFENNSFLVEGQEIAVQPGQYAFSNQQVWFDASVEHACTRMREVYEDRATAAKKSAAARNYVRTFHSVEATGLRYQKLLQNFI